MTEKQEASRNDVSWKNSWLFRKIGLLEVSKATFVKQLQIQVRYKMNFVMFWVRTIVFIGVFALFAYTFRFKGVGYSFADTLIFFLIGFYIIMYDSTALWSPYEMVMNDIYNGTLEYIYSTPSSKTGYFVGAILAEAFLTTVITLPISLFLIVYAHLNWSQVFMMIVVLLAVIMILMSFGVMFGLLVIVFKQAGPLASIIGSFFTFFSGFLFPVQALPMWIQWLSYLLPYTWGIDILRIVIMKDAWTPIFPLFVEIGIMAAQFTLFWLLAVYLLGRVEVKVKKQGLHLI